MLLQRLLELEPEDFQVQVAPTGEKALSLANSNPPDLFMIDLNLADSNGLTLLQNLRAQPHFAHTPMIMSSGMNVEQEALAAGADLFLLKPFEPGEIADIFLKLIG